MDQNIKQLFECAKKHKITLPISQDMVNKYSCLNQMSLAKINNLIVAAVQTARNIGNGIDGAYGLKTDEKNNIIRTMEIRTKTDIYLSVIFTDKDKINKKEVGEYAAFTRIRANKLYPYNLNDDNGLLIMTVLLFNFLHFDKDVEMRDNLEEAMTILQKGVDDTNKFQLANCLAVVSENAYRRLLKETIIEMFDKEGKPNKIGYNIIESGKIVPDNIVYGKFTFYDNISAAEDVVQNTEDNLLLHENGERAFTEKEKQLIPSIDPWYVMPHLVPDICRLVKKTSNAYLPKRNFMLRGPSSTGKTSAVKAMAAILGLPYVYITCSSDTESYAFLGEPMYDEKGNVRYITSPFIEAMKYGWVVEIQEPYIIAKQGVLTAMNGLLETNGQIQLPSGEIVKRHKDTIVFFTTNVSYVGCKKPNQSVLRRFNNVFEVSMPSSTEVIARVSSMADFKDMALLKKMYECINKINTYLKEKCIDDGVCGISEFVDWVQTYMCLNNSDIIEAAKSTVISKATDDEIAQNDIILLMETVFPKKDAFYFQ